MFSTEGTDDPRDLHTDEELSIRDQTRILLREAANVLRVCSTWHPHSGGPSVTGALANKINLFFLQYGTIEFLGKPGSRQSPSNQETTAIDFEKITQQIIDGFSVCVQQKPSCIEINFTRHPQEETAFPWIAKASVESPEFVEVPQECIHANGRDALDAACNLRKQVLLLLRQRKQGVDLAIASMGESEESKE